MGTIQTGNDGQCTGGESAKKQLRRFVDTRWIVLLTLFFITLFLGLPLLWASRGFSWLAKVMWTIATLLWSALVCYLFYLVMAWCWSSIDQELQML